MRLGFYIESHLPGGMERFLFDLVRELAREGQDATVFHAGDPAFARRLAEAGARARCRFVRVWSARPWEEKVWALRPPRAAWRMFLGLMEVCKWLSVVSNVRPLARAFRAEPVDVLHVVNGGYPAAMSCASAAWAARRAGVRRVILTLTGLPRRRLWGRLEALADRLAAGHVDMVASCCRRGTALAAERRGFPPEKLVTVHNGLGPMPPADADAARRLRDRYGLAGRRVIGNVSALEPYKGHRHLVEAAALLRPSHPDLACLIVGDGQEKAALARQARERGLEGVVTLTGFVEGSPAAALSALDVFVHPTLEDALPYAVMEAMAMGKPVVASAVGGIPEQVRDGDTGRLVPPGDPAALAAAVGALLDDPAEAARMGARAKAAVERLFPLPAMAAAYRRLYAGERP